MSDYIWPYIDQALKDAVQAQVETSLSDRDGSGVIGEFEAKFRSFTGSPYAVAFASGTGAIHAMCLALKLTEGDHVVACAYGFPATVTPFAYEGVEVTFVDADESGNPDPGQVAAAVAALPRAGALVLSHIWGNAVDPAVYRSSAEGVTILQDLSHAHFARVGSTHIARLSPLAAFSMNQKALTCGEGGVLTAESRDLADAALLAGDYNHRCRTISTPEYLPYVRTGMGLKLRPHPLAMSIGVDQLAKADSIEARRRHNLQVLVDAASESDIIRPLAPKDSDGVSHGLYVFAFEVLGDEPLESVTSRLERDGGLPSIDVPGATGEISALPRFRRLGSNPVVGRDVPGAVGTFPTAERLSRRVMKVPLWGYTGDEAVVERYAAALASA